MFVTTPELNYELSYRAMASRDALPFLGRLFCGALEKERWPLVFGDDRERFREISVIVMGRGLTCGFSNVQSCFDVWLFECLKHFVGFG